METEVLEKLMEQMYAFNAHKQFNDFCNAIDDEEKLVMECRKIYELLDKLVLNKEKSQFIKIIHAGEIYHRARIINTKDYDKQEKGIGIGQDGKLSGYNEENSREPMIGISGAGRNNIAGDSYLYIASDEETACLEVKPIYGSLISLSSFEMSKDMKIIDFSDDKSFQRTDTEFYNMSMGIFFTQLMSQFTLPIKDTKKYRITQIISDYLRKTGIDGIMYRSFFSPNGKNITLFNCYHDNIAYQSSKVVLYKYAKHSFWDYNEGKAIISCADDELEYNPDIAKEQLQSLAKTFPHK